MPFYDFVAVSPAPTARVLASFDDTARSPFLVERPYGDGRVVLWTSSIDKAWNRVPDSPGTFVPLVLELLRAVGTRVEQIRNLGVGTPVELVVEAFPRNATLVMPAGGQRPIEGDPIERADRRWTLPLIDGAWLERVGVYEVRADAARAEPIAIRLDPRESDLARSTPLEVEAIHPALVVASAEALAKGDDEAAAPRQGELWRGLALAALLFLIGESLWGAVIGARRRVGAGPRSRSSSRTPPPPQATRSARPGDSWRCRPRGSSCSSCSRAHSPSPRWRTGRNRSRRRCAGRSSDCGSRAS